MESRKMVQMNYFQGNNGDTDIENRIMDIVGEGRRGWDEVRSILPCVN